MTKTEKQREQVKHLYKQGSEYFRDEEYELAIEEFTTALREFKIISRSEHTCADKEQYAKLNYGLACAIEHNEYRAGKIKAFKYFFAAYSAYEQLSIDKLSVDSQAKLAVDPYVKLPVDSQARLAVDPHQKKAVLALNKIVAIASKYGDQSVSAQRAKVNALMKMGMLRFRQGDELNASVHYLGALIDYSSIEDARSRLRVYELYFLTLQIHDGNSPWYNIFMLAYRVFIQQDYTLHDEVMRVCHSVFLDSKQSQSVHNVSIKLAYFLILNIFKIYGGTFHLDDALQKQATELAYLFKRLEIVIQNRQTKIAKSSTDENDSDKSIDLCFQSAPPPDYNQQLAQRSKMMRQLWKEVCASKALTRVPQDTFFKRVFRIKKDSQLQHTKIFHIPILPRPHSAFPNRNEIKAFTWKHVRSRLSQMWNCQLDGSSVNPHSLDENSLPVARLDNLKKTKWVKRSSGLSPCRTQATKSASWPYKRTAESRKLSKAKMLLLFKQELRFAPQDAFECQKHAKTKTKP